MNYDVIFIFGPQGSGKGTQSQLLAQKLGFFYWDMGAILRAEREFVLADGKTVGSIVDPGSYLNDAQLFQIIEKRIGELPEYQGVIFDGVPRSIGQAEFMLNLMKKRGVRNFLTMFLTLPREESVKRLLLRATKEKRADDTPEGINRRLQWYEEVILPTLEYLKKYTTFIEIDGRPPISEVTCLIDKALGLENA